MKDVLNKLSEANDELLKLQTKAKEDIAECISREEHNTKISEALDLREQELRKKELDVQNILDLQAYHAEAEELMANAKKLSEQLDADKKAFESYKTEETAKLKDQRETTTREAANVEKRKSEVDDEVKKRVNDFLISSGLKKA